MDQDTKEGISRISLLMKHLFINLFIYPDIWSDALQKFIDKENPWGESGSRVLQLFRQAGWTPDQIALLESSPGALADLHKRMFPTPFLDFTVDKAVTEQALEEAQAGHGMMYKVVRRKLMFAGIGTIRELVRLTENEAVRVFGSSKQTKAFRTIEALLAKHGLCFGMKLS